MMSRRELMAVAAAAVPASGLCAVSGAEPGAVGDRSAVYTVVYDERFAEGARFGGQAARLGYRTRAISGDVTALWYDDLYHRWKKGPAAIAGLTTADAALCLGMFAADAGLRCVFQTEHRMAAGVAAVEHRVRGPDDWRTLAALESCGEQWPELLPHLIGSCPIAHAKQTATLVAALPAREATERLPLVSWMFAPIQRS